MRHKALSALNQAENAYPFNQASDPLSDVHDQTNGRRFELRVS